MKALNKPKHCLTIVMLSLTTGLCAQAPGGVSSQLKLWIRSDAASTITATAARISQWKYLNHATHAFTAAGTERPTLRTNGLNFQPTAQFSGAQVMFGPTVANAPIAAGDDDYSLFAVWNSTYTGDAGERLWTQWNCVSQRAGFSLATAYYGTDHYYGAQFEINPYNQGIKQRFTPGSWNISQLSLQNVGNRDFELTDHRTITTGPLLLSSNNNAGNTTRNIATANHVLGAQCDRYSEPFHGELAELIVYDRPITGVEKNKIFSYLALKYGISLPGFNYVAANWNGAGGTVFWNTQAVYNNDIFGIGRDETLAGPALNLPRSNSINTGSGNGAGQLGRGNIILSANPANLDNGEYLMVANNGLALTGTTSELPPEFSNAQRLRREWKVQHTGNVGSLELSFDISGLALSGTLTDPNNFSLLIDQDGDGDFTTGFPTIVVANAIVNGRPNFVNVTLNQGVVFTFATQVPMQLLAQPGRPSPTRPAMADALLFYPNPFQLQVACQLTLAHQQTVFFYLYDQHARLLLQQRKQGKAGTNRFSLTGLGHLPAGRYQLAVYYDNKVAHYPLLKE